MIKIPFAEVGSVLVTGYELSLQSPIGRVLVAQHLEAGGTVVALTDYESDASEQTSSLADTLRALEIDKAALERFHTVAEVRRYHTSDALAEHIRLKKARTKRPLLIVRDMGSSMAELMPGASWLSQAEEVALLMDCRVLTVAHHGRAGIPAPDFLKFKADEVWRCTASLNLAVTLQREKPLPATVHLRGAVSAYGPIVFANEEIREFSHV